VPELVGEDGRTLPAIAKAPPKLAVSTSAVRAVARGQGPAAACHVSAPPLAAHRLYAGPLLDAVELERIHLVWAQQGDDLAALNVEIEPVEGDHAAEAPDEAPDPNPVPRGEANAPGALRDMRYSKRVGSLTAATYGV
jgi:hypothetical protein